MAWGKKIMEIEKFNKEIKKCSRCRLSETRINALCGEGNINAKLMLIAQAPGENEDREGKMFIGSSGKVLDELFKKANIDRKEIYMTNLIKCMLPKYRRPKQDEIEICSKYLDKEIALINPKTLVPLGIMQSNTYLRNVLSHCHLNQNFARFTVRFFWLQIKKSFLYSILLLFFITILLRKKS